MRGFRVFGNVLLDLDADFHGVQFVRIPGAVHLRSNSSSCALFQYILYFNEIYKKGKNKRTKTTDLSLFSAESSSLRYGFCHFYVLGLWDLFLPGWPQVEEITQIE